MYLSYAPLPLPLPRCFHLLLSFKIIDRFYTPLYEKGMKENQNKPMETTRHQKTIVDGSGAGLAAILFEFRRV